MKILNIVEDLKSAGDLEGYDAVLAGKDGRKSQEWFLRQLHDQITSGWRSWLVDWIQARCVKLVELGLISKHNAGFELKLMVGLYTHHNIQLTYKKCTEYVALFERNTAKIQEAYRAQENR